MRRVLLMLATITLMLPPTVLLAQSPSPEAKTPRRLTRRPSASSDGSVMKDSWITTKTKLALTTDGRTKARHIAVETQAATVMLRGKVSSTEERAAAEDIARNISGVAYVSNALQIVPDDQRQAIDAKDDGIATAIRERLVKDSQLKDYDIKVRSDNSVVTLRGKVSDPKVKSHASDVVRGVPGVRRSETSSASRASSALTEPCWLRRTSRELWHSRSENSRKRGRSSASAPRWIASMRATGARSPQSFQVTLRHRVTGHLKVLGRRVTYEPGASVHPAVALSLIGAYRHGNAGADPPLLRGDRRRGGDRGRHDTLLQPSCSRPVLARVGR